jgi:hypothetical protein
MFHITVVVHLIVTLLPATHAQKCFHISTFVCNVEQYQTEHTMAIYCNIYIAHSDTHSSKIYIILQRTTDVLVLFSVFLTVTWRSIEHNENNGMFLSVVIMINIDDFKPTRSTVYINEAVIYILQC